MNETAEKTTDTGRPFSDSLGDFLISRGGPFYELQERLGLLREKALRAPRRAAIFVAVAWGGPLLLTLFAGTAYGPWDSHPYLLSPDAWARFVIAIGLFLLMDRTVEERLRTQLGQFAAAPLLAPSAVPKAAQAVVKGLQRLQSGTAEAVCLVLAYAITFANFILLLDDGRSSWMIAAGPDGGSLTLAGWWCALISSPLFWFLLLRWLWRHAVWALLLRDLAKLELRLVVTHPDRNAGLGFLGQYPNAFVTFVLALSAVVGAALARAFLEGSVSPTTLGQIMSIWLAIMLALFAIPLMAFSGPLKRLKQETLLATSAAATRRERALERSLLGRNMMAGDDADKTALEDLPDANKTFEAAKKLSTSLFSRSSLIPVCAAALVPLVLAGATQLPFRELLKMAKGLLLL